MGGGGGSGGGGGGDDDDLSHSLRRIDMNIEHK